MKRNPTLLIRGFLTLVILFSFANPVSSSNSPTGETLIPQKSTELKCQLVTFITCDVTYSQNRVELIPQPILDSSTVEQRPVKVQVVGSSPTPRAQSLPSEMPTSGDKYGTATKLYKDTIYKYRGCVPYAKAKTGINRSIGNGARKGIQGQEPRVGAIGAMKGSVPHAVFITAINGNQITFTEAGYLYEEGSYWIDQRTAPASMFLGYIYN